MDKTCLTSMVNVCRKTAVRESTPEDDTVVRTGLKASLKAKIAAHKAQKKGYTPVDDTVERTGLKASIKAKAAAHKAQKKGNLNNIFYHFIDFKTEMLRTSNTSLAWTSNPLFRPTPYLRSMSVSGYTILKTNFSNFKLTFNEIQMADKKKLGQN